MSARTIYTGQDARSRLLRGANKVARAVSTTYGPGGRTCIMDRMAGFIVTKDGATVARDISLVDRVENQGCMILKNACIKVNDEVGDGTTTTAVLAAAMMAGGHKLVATGVDPNGLIRGMRSAGDDAMSIIGSFKTRITKQSELERVAFLASNGDVEIAANLAEACMAVGKDGTVTIEDGVGLTTTLEFNDGMSIDQGPCSQSFLGNQSERVINSPLVAVIHGRLKSLDDVQDLMEVASQWPQNELVVFCLIAEAIALNTMVVNDSKGIMKCIVIGAPGVQFRKIDYLGDIAALTGATMVDPIAGLNHKEWNPEWFGSLKQITIKPNSTAMISIPEAADSIADRIVEIRAHEHLSVSDYDGDRFKERMAKLSGGMAVMKIGGATEIAMKERRARVEDALGSVRAALRSGVVPGGGIACLRASTFIQCSGDQSSEDLGRRVIKLALAKPLEIIASNTGEEGKMVIDSVLNSWGPVDWESGEGFDWSGWDATTNAYRNLGEDPMVVDPVDVVIAAINAAISVATTLLMVETAIVIGD